MIAQILNGGAFESSKFSKSTGHPLIRIRDVGNSVTDCCYSGEFDPTYQVNKGDLIVGMDGDFKCARWKGGRALLNQRVCKITVDSRYYTPGFLDVALPPYLIAINERTSSVTVKHLSSKSIADIPLPLPPLAEQGRIVAKADELFTKLDAGVKALNAIKAQLKRYRQSVLKSAFEGKLTAEWREARKGKLEPASVPLERIKEERKKKLGSKYKESPLVDASELPKLPEGWAWARLLECSDRITDGTHVPPKFTDKGVPFLFVRHVVNGSITFEDTKFISEQTYQRLNERCPVEPGDVLYTAVGSYGVAIPVLRDERFSFQRHIAHIKLSSYLSHEYLSSCLNSPFCLNQARTAARGVAQKTVTLGDLSIFVVPVAPVQEQHQIVSEIESCFSVADAIEKTVDQSLAQSERLRQSILKRAFEGKLVPQDPNDPPASELLERIRMERESGINKLTKKIKKGTTAGR